MTPLQAAPGGDYCSDSISLIEETTILLVAECSLAHGQEGESIVINWCWFPGAQLVKNLPAMKETGFHPWVGKILWKRESQPTAVFLPGKSHRQRSLAGNSLWGRKELDMTEQLKLGLSLLQLLNMSYRGYQLQRTVISCFLFLSCCCILYFSSSLTVAF